MKFRLTSLILVILFAFPTTGFVCATRVEKMEADVEALQMQFSDMQQRFNNEQTRLSALILKADAKLNALDDTQDESSSAAAQQNVQLVLELEQERAALAELRGRLDVQQRSLETLQASMQSVMGSFAASGGGDAVMLPNDQPGLLAFIEAKKAENNAADQFTATAEYLRRYPNDAQTEPLLGQLVALSSGAKRNEETVSYATQYLQKFPQGAAHKDVIYHLGQAGLSLGNCGLAVQSFEMLKKSGYKGADALLKTAKETCK